MTYELAVTIKTMLNFTMELIEEEDAIYGELLTNGTWLGIVGMLDRQEADLSIMDFSITETRSRVIDFGTGIYPQAAQLFMHLPRKSASWWTFVEVFNSLFWLLLVLVALLSAMLFHNVFRQSNFQDQNRPVSKSFASVMLALGALNVPERATKLSTRSSFLSVCLFGAMIYWVYNSVLVSILTVDIVVLPINSLEELAEKSQWVMDKLIYQSTN